MYTEKYRQQIAILEFIERAIKRQPAKRYVTLTELGKCLDKQTLFANSTIGARLARQIALDDLFERGILELTTNHTAGRSVQHISFACDDWEVMICAVNAEDQKM